MQCPSCQAENPADAKRCSHCGSALGAAVADAPAVAAGYRSGFGDQFNASLIIWKMNLGDLAVLTLVLMLLIWIPIANIGFLAGYLRAILKVVRGEGRAEVGDLFKAWDCFGNLLVYVVLVVIASAILSVVPLLGVLASAALGFAAFPGFYLIIDRNRNFVDAFKWGISAIQANPVDWLLTYLVGMLISGIGTLLLFIGVILTMPLGALIFCQQYENNKPA
ncbi:conserved membrane protein of unknown function [Sterolibacterium denitrificans]|uniref:Zinc-ribbon domain-containing protein n=2 Tax=Sterolibacterium denitrificans TaxID=157592 RepID=A0A7Z7HSH0_9PROT|nr:zinc-ribbon domain-containing protein [Sterolibacterium denitrificans]SMB30070.1 conserved membrane protein of unknown function [Sterolibacterium denitrificans]